MPRSGSFLFASKAIVAFSLAAALTATAAADVLVVGSTGRASAGYPVGVRLPDDAPLRLSTGDSVTLLGPGGTRIFRGPGLFRPSDPIRRGGPAITRADENRVGGITMSSLERGRAESGIVLVVRSTGPSARSFPRGRRLAANAPITLRAGDRVMLLTGGATHTVRGPGTFTPATIRRQRAASIAQTNRRARTGAIRSREGGDPPQAASTASAEPSLQDIEAARGGTFCVLDRDAVHLWRPAGNEAATVLIEAPGGDAQRELEWPAGTQLLAWPADLPIEEGATYRLRPSGSVQPVEIAFQLLADEPEAVDAGLVELADALVRRGCTAQLERVVEQTRLSEAPEPAL